MKTIFYLLFSIILLGIFTSCRDSKGTIVEDPLVIQQVDSLINVSRDFAEKGEYERAFEINAKAEEIALETFGPESSAYESCLFNRGRVNDLAGNQEEAEKWYLKSLTVTEKSLGREHPNFRRNLNNLAIFYHNMGNYEKSKPRYLESMVLLEKSSGREHSDYAAILNNLASLYRDKGNYGKAEPMFLEALTIREKTLGRKHPDYAWSLNNLANLYRNMGKYEKVEPIHLEAIAIRKEILGPDHPDYAASLNNLAVHYRVMGKYDKAEPYNLQAMEIMEKVLGPEHWKYASSVSNLAILYLEMGNYGKAEPLYLEVIAIWETILGREHPIYATSLNNLALLYHTMDKLEKAEALFLESIGFIEKSSGTEHPHYAMIINNKANLYKSMGKYEKSVPLYLEAIAIQGKLLGPEHPDYAASLVNLAALYQYMAKYRKAELLYLEAMGIQEKILGREHPSYAVSLIGLATLYEKQNKFVQSEPYFQEALQLNQDRLAASTAFLSERELALYATTGKTSLSLNSKLLNRPAENRNALASLSFDQILFQKGFLMQAASRLHLLGDSSPEATAINNDLKAYRRRISAELSKPITERKDLETLEEKANKLERELARVVSGYAEAMQQINWQEVQDALNPDELALEFIHFDVNFPEETDSVQYAVLLLRHDSDQPEFIPLFEQNKLNVLLENATDRKVDYVNNLYATSNKHITDLEQSRPSLYELIWAKIEANGIQDISTIYYSPSGILHRLNMSAISINEDKNLSDLYHLVTLTSTRQLVVSNQTKTYNQDAVLIGGVNFDWELPEQPNIDDDNHLVSRSIESAWHELSSRGDLWSYLHWTESEVDLISDKLTQAGFNSIIYKGMEATEDRIKNLGTDGYSPRILHIATHGFFFPDPDLPSYQGSLLTENNPIFTWSDNPMIRSGLILAGGNYAWEHGRAPENEINDGVLTAYEISQLNLSNTELVILSACETGLGDILGNEGVYGLQRAFKIAGAKYLIMSLWQVPDRETKDFMVNFYRNWLEEGLSIPEAFRKTQQEMRDEFYNPFFWAGFILIE